MSIKTRSHPWLIALAAAVWCVGAPAMAIENNQVRGEIANVDAEANQLTLEVTEAGSDSIAREGSTQTYRVDEDTRVRMDDPRTTVLGTTGAVTIDDLQDGTRVLLEFEDVGGQLMAREIGVDNGDSASGDRSSVAGTDSGSSAGAANDGTGTGAAAGSEDRASDMAAMESEGRRDRLPATSSMLPFLAMLGLGFAGLAVVLRIRRRS